METYHRPRKRFGQNFLHDQNVITAIVTAAQLDSSDHILEIGPGQGALTERILPLVATVDIMEIDRDLAQSFVERNHATLTVHIGDALRLNWSEILTENNYKLIANLPYNISTQILFKMLEQRQHFTRMVLMFQKEVGDRLRAQPGTKEYGALTVMCQLWFDVSRVILVSPQAFRPPPKIMSEVLRFDRLDQPRVSVDNPDFFQRVVKAAFAQRRKTLRNCLYTAGFSAASVNSAEENTSIDMHRRGETLSIQEFSQLAMQLHTAEHN